MANPCSTWRSASPPASGSPTSASCPLRRRPPGSPRRWPPPGRSTPGGKDAAALTAVLTATVFLGAALVRRGRRPATSGTASGAWRKRPTATSPARSSRRRRRAWTATTSSSASTASISSARASRLTGHLRVSVPRSTEFPTSLPFKAGDRLRVAARIVARPRVPQLPRAVHPDVPQIAGAPCAGLDQEPAPRRADRGGAPRLARGPDLVDKKT